ncbi:MAG: hypothetical protein ABIY50_13655 [Ignavibacteria bacterium]
MENLKTMSSNFEKSYNLELENKTENILKSIDELENDIKEYIRIYGNNSENEGLSNMKIGSDMRLHDRC